MRVIRTVLILWAALLAAPSMADDMQKYLNETQDLVRQGKHGEALERFVWFHEHALEHDPAMSGVRLSFALMYWKSLAEDYPPAHKAMVEVRDRSAKQVADGEGDWQLFQDVAALNRTLGENDKTVELFQTVDERQPGQARRYWDIARGAVIGAKRYDLAGKYIGNPATEFGRIKAAYDHTKTLYDRPEFGGARLKQFNENQLVEASKQLIEVALALGDEKRARTVQAMALAVLDDPRLRDATPPADAKDRPATPPDEPGNPPTR